MENDERPVAKFLRLQNGDDVIAEVIETEDDNPMLVKQWTGSTRYGDKINIVLRSGAPRDLQQEYKANRHLHWGVMQRSFIDVFDQNWFEVLHLVDDEPMVVMYNLKQWTFQ